jgi:hypothetical protein
MLANEKAEFASLVGRLCEVFDRKPSADLIDSYWNAVQMMSLGGFRRATERAIQTSERMPRPSQLWGLYKEQRQAANAPTAPEKPERTYDSLHCFGQRCLLNYLKEHQGVPEHRLETLISEKNRVVTNFRLIESEERITAEEVREAMFRAFRAA